MTGVIVIFPPVFFRRINRIPCSVRQALLSLLLLFSVSSATALEKISLQWGFIDSPWFSTESVSVHASLLDSRYEIDVKHLKIKAFGQKNRFDLKCDKGQWQEPFIRCDAAQLSITNATKKPVKLKVGFRLRSDFKDLELKLYPPKKSASRLPIVVHFQQSAAGWVVRVAAKKQNMAELIRLVQSFSGLAFNALEVTSGQIDFDLNARGSSGLEALQWRIKLQQFSLAAGEASEYLAESLSVTTQGQYRPAANRHEFDYKVSLKEGEILTPWVYLAPQKGAIVVSGKGVFKGKSQQLKLSQGVIKDPATGALQYQLQWDQKKARLKQLQLDSASLNLASVWQGYLQPVAPAGLLADLQMQGNASIHLRIKDALLTKFQADLKKFFIKDSAPAGEAPRIELSNLHGEVNYDARQSSRSHLAWDGAKLLNTIPLGASQAEFIVQKNGFELLGSLNQPLFDGRLILDELKLRDKVIQLSGVLTPVSMQQVSQAFGWPQLAGKLSGVIPQVTISQHRIRVDGSLLVRLFDGRILIHDLQLFELLGALPVLQADVRVHDLDLETLTSTFDFGRISGTLEGQVNNLRLEDWQPLRFDADFHSPQDDPRRHRISQRAVDNIASIGGGISGALSNTFMSFFKEFGYKRLGIRCRLQKGVCTMGGVSPAKNGYYLVEPGGIPRIAIVGYNRKTDWQRLLRQLSSISSENAPVIQ